MGEAVLHGSIEHGHARLCLVFCEVIKRKNIKRGKDQANRKEQHQEKQQMQVELGQRV